MPLKSRSSKKLNPAKPKQKKPDEKPIFTDNSITSRTMDGFDNFVSRIGLNNKNALSGGTYVYNLITRNRVLLEMAYRGSWIVGRVVDCVAQDMTRAGLEITTAKGNEDLKEIKSAISRLKIWQSLCALIKWGRLYGGSLGVVQIEGQDLSTPLNLDSIAKGQFHGIVVYDRWQLNPKVWDLIDSGPDLGLPAYYDIVTDPRAVEPGPQMVSTQTVHYSRVIRYSGIDLPYFQAITEMMWGESVLERLWDRLISFDNATMSSASLVDRANLRTVGIEGLREIIAAGGQAYEGLIQMFEVMRELQVNEGLTLLDKNDTFASTSYTFAGLSDMLLQFAQQLSGSTEIPLIVLFGQSPSGLNASGDNDIRTYYDSVNSQQESKLRNGWEMLLKVLWRSTFGKPMPDDLEFTFTPLWQMSATDKANNAKTTAETIIGAFDNNVIDKATAMQELRDKSGDTGLFSNITDEQIAEAGVEEPPMPDDDPAVVNKPVASFGADAKYRDGSLERTIVEVSRGKDGLIIQTKQVGPDREVEEQHNRERFANHFHYSDIYTGNTRTYDVEGNYSCGDCNMADNNKCLLVGKLTIDRKAGSCGDWENIDGGDPELPLEEKTVESAGYGVADNGVGFGCHRCPFASKAIDLDSKGRSLYCGKGDFRVYPKACCGLNGAKLKPNTPGNKSTDGKWKLWK